MVLLFSATAVSQPRKRRRCAAPGSEIHCFNEAAVSQPRKRGFLVPEDVRMQVLLQ